MGNIHIRLEYEEALEGKKEFLSSQLNLLEILKKLKNYKGQRKKELILKGKFKKELAALKTEINQIQEFFPKEEGKELEKGAIKEYKEKKHKENIESQLKEIKEKLAALSYS